MAADDAKVAAASAAENARKAEAVMNAAAKTADDARKTADSTMSVLLAVTGAGWTSGAGPAADAALATSAVGAAPGAPAPPVTLLAAFAGVLGLRQVRTRLRKAA